MSANDGHGTAADRLTPDERARRRERADSRTGAPMDPAPQKPGEIGGKDAPEPTRFGDWEVGGRCTDF
ncbi:MAG: DUF1674 domain-containing protein [Azospirillaceae bacterium]